MKDIISNLKSLDSDKIIEKIKNNNTINLKINNIDIEIIEEDLIINEIPKENLCVGSNKDFTIGLDTNIDNDLKMEGIIRDLIRYVQNFRKESY